MTAMFLDRVGQFTHHAYTGTAIHQLDALFGQNPAQVTQGPPTVSQIQQLVTGS